MRIGVITSSFPRWHGDVAGMFVQAHVRWLEAQGHVVDVIALPRKSAAIGIPDAFEAHLALPAVARAALMTRDVAGLARGTATMMRQAWRAAPRWDAICAHWLVPAATVGALAAWRARGARGVPFLAIAHGGDVALLARSGLLPAALARLVALEARIAWVSTPLRDQALAACGPDLRAIVSARSIVSAMGVDGDRFAAIAARRAGNAVVAAREPLGDRPFRLLVVARLVAVKGVDQLFATLRDVARPCELTIVGDGPLRSALQGQADSLHASAPQHRVLFRGALDGGALDDEYAVTDAVVLPSRVATATSRGEGMPVVALEALTAGIPLIHSGSGGLAGLSADPKLAAQAYQVVLHDPASMSQAIETIAHGIAGPPVTSTRVRCSGAVVQVATLRADLGWDAVGPALWSHWHA
ncbi:MAG: glycosyltransferase [Myxococcales bacterium]|nr:glycosyltransferase [Myxococcales bacterium]